MTERHGERRVEQREEWHKAKVFSLAHLFATLTAILAAAGFFWAFAQEFGIVKSEVARHSKEISNIQSGQVARDTALDNKLTAMRMEQKQDMQRIENKLDRLIERRL